MSRPNYLQIKLTDAEQAAYKRLAESEQLSTAEWARKHLNWVVRESDKTRVK